MKKITSFIIFLLAAMIAAGCGKSENDPGRVSLDTAEETALSDAGLSASDVSFLSVKTEQTDGISVYNIEFCADNMKYEYEIHAGTGEIYSKNMEAIGGTVLAENQTADSRNDEQADGRQTNQPQTGQAQPKQNDPVQSEQTQPKQDAPVQSEQTQPKQDAPVQSAETRPAQSGDGQVTLDAAKTAALTDAGLTAADVTYTKEALDYEDGVAVYEIEFYTSTHEYEYEIHAASGTVHSRCVEPCVTRTGHHGKHHREDHRENCSDDYCSSYWCDYCHNGGIAGTDIGAEEAKNAALNHAGLSAEDVTFTKAELDWEDGAAVYEIEFISGITEYEYKVSASDGTILEYETD